ncbi:HCNGP-like protein-domain-containing protein [Phycomyces blakesleeanus]|uniref:HCNGP-like protein-domain-containing protein n=1 Tax=Phycomyces blakesleeanus TaxID=4837 RepID=A0ABR3AKF9_PHYBL
MSALTGLVNYSDDEDASDEEFERQETAKPNVNHSPKKIVPIKPVEKPVAIKNTSILPELEHSAALYPSQDTNVLDRSRRLKALLAPKPIEGVVNWGIPPEPETEVEEDRAANIAHFLELRASGHKLNDHLQRNKSFRNPRIYAKLVEFVELDEIGSNFPKEYFDPHGFPKDAYIDGILETQRRLAEEKALSHQSRTNIAFTSASTQSHPKQTQDSSGAMAAAMATAAKVASRIAIPPSQEVENEAKKGRKWDSTSGREQKRRH